MKRWISLILLLVPFLASAAGFWDGNAALQRGDSTFEGGMFAASNSFPENTQIVIVNATTGKTVTATVTKRIDGQSDILVLLSPPAAAALGISQGTLASVRVTVAEPTAVAAAPKSDQTLSQDPDLNPGAAYPQAAATQAAAPATTPPADQTAQQTTPTADATQAAAPATTPPADQTATTTAPADQTAQAAAPATTPPADQTAQQTTPTADATQAAAPADQSAQAQVESLPAQPAPTTAAVTPAVPANTPEAPQPEQPQQAQTVPTATPPATNNPAPAPTLNPGSDDAAIVAAAEARTPQKQLFQPPREDPKFAYQKPAVTPEQPAQAAQQPAVEAAPAITAVIGEPGVSPAPEQPSDVALAEAAPPDESVAQEIVGEGTPAPTQAPAPAVALAAPEIVPEGQPAAVTPAVQPAEPVQTEVTGPAAVPPAAAEAPKLALVAPVAPTPQKAPEPQTAIAAKPAETQAPATTTTTKSSSTTAQSKPAAALLPRPGKPGTYYVQLGAYATEKVAKDLAATLASTYPALVLNSTGAGTPTFRVVVGPLNKAESGTLLTWFKRKGFPDAFLRQD